MKDNKNIDRLLKHQNIVAFHYDDRNWGVGEISDKLWKPKFRDFCVARVDMFKGFLEMPYVEDVFGDDDGARYAWMHELTVKDGSFYDHLRDANIFRITKLNSQTLSKSFMIRQYNGENAGCLKSHLEASNFLLPFLANEGERCKITREQYDKMGFEKKRNHVYEIKESVLGFLNCLVNASNHRR